MPNYVDYVAFGVGVAGWFSLAEGQRLAASMVASADQRSPVPVVGRLRPAGAAASWPMGNPIRQSSGPQCCPVISWRGLMDWHCWSVHLGRLRLLWTSHTLVPEIRLECRCAGVGPPAAVNVWTMLEALLFALYAVDVMKFGPTVPCLELPLFSLRSISF